MSLLDDLVQGANAAAGIKPCALCDIVAGQTDDVTREHLAAAAAGTIGVHSLVEILRNNGLTGSDGETVGRRTIERHRKEGHQ